MPKHLNLPSSMQVLENGAWYGLMLEYRGFQFLARWSVSGSEETGLMSLKRTRKWLAESGYRVSELERLP